MMTERFELLEQIGKGGMGTVWRARDTETGEAVALKLLHEQYADDPYFLERFEREVEVTRRVQSAHVVRMVGYGVREGRPYVAMEYVEGRTLRDILRERGQLDWPEAKALLRQVVLGLGAAHAVGVVHRDVKPSNILVKGDGTAKLVDFGIAKAADLTALTGTHTMLGTTGYMAPEGKATPQADLYALGCVAYEMLTGVPPFEGETPAEVLVKHIREAPDLSSVPEGARRMVGWLLEKEASARPASAEVLVAALEGSYSSPIAHSTVGGASGREASNRRKVALFGGVPLVVLLAGAGAAFALSGGDDPEPAASADLTTTSQAVSPTADSTATPTLTASPTSAQTATPVLPTATPVPPTATQVPPTPTHVPPTPTHVPPTATPIPPTPTPGNGLPDFVPTGARLVNARSTLVVTVENRGPGVYDGPLLVGAGGFGIPPPSVTAWVELPPGATVTIQLSLGIAVHLGATAHVAVDPNNSVPEANEFDNAADFPLDDPEPALLGGSVGG